MAAATNGIALYGGLRPYCATFFVFSDYLKGALRLSALMRVPVLYVFTHDSIGVGEDGPTHEPIEHLAALRSIPGMTVFRPADGKETAAGYAVALQLSGPTALILTRQSLPTLDQTGPDAIKGAYIIKDAENPDMILIASGSEVNLVLEAAGVLQEQNIAVRVVSMPSMELFEQQPEAYRESVLPSNIRKRIAVEAAATLPWHRYTGLDGLVIGIDRFGASAPGQLLFEKLGLTVDRIVKESKALLES
jgi:transketolase